MNPEIIIKQLNECSSLEQADDIIKRHCNLHQKADLLTILKYLNIPYKKYWKIKQLKELIIERTTGVTAASIDPKPVDQPTNCKNEHLSILRSTVDNAYKIIGESGGRYHSFFHYLISLMETMSDEDIDRVVAGEAKFIIVYSNPIDREEAMKAYCRVKERIGFPHIEIWELQQEMGVPMEQLKEFLLSESRQGRAILSSGDWSLSSKETRSGVVYIRGDYYLQVCFKEA